MKDPLSSKVHIRYPLPFLVQGIRNHPFELRGGESSLDKKVTLPSERSVLFIAHPFKERMNVDHRSRPEKELEHTELLRDPEMKRKTKQKQKRHERAGG